MKVLMITGDKNIFKEGSEAHGRFELQRAQLEILTPIFMGRGSVWPKIPAGQFDVVTSQDPFWRGLFAWRVARRKGLKLNIQVHTDLSGTSLVKHVLAQIVLRHANSVRVVSERIKKQVEGLRIKAPIHVLPVFVDLEKFRHIMRRPHTDKTILWMGRFEKEKDPEYAITVLKEVLKLIDNVKLVILGRGSLEAQLKKELQDNFDKGAANLPIQVPYEFPGWQTDTTVFLETADVVLCTSKHESWGASIVEALAAGVPVVAPDVGIAKEAGANVVERKDLADEVIRVLKSSQKGELKLKLLSKTEYGTAFVQSLV